MPAARPEHQHEARAEQPLTKEAECPPRASLCREDAFASTHHTDQRRRGVSVALEGGRAYLALPDGGAAPLPGILLLHSARGLTKNVELWADRWGEAGYATLAVDFYQGRVAANDVEASQLRDLANQRADDLVQTARAAYDFLATDSRTQSKARALVGWSYGGAWATYLATQLPGVRAVVSYGGNALENAAQAAKLGAPLLLVRGESDAKFRKAAAEALAERLTTAGKSVELLTVAGGHAFGDPTRRDYSAAGNWQGFVHARQFLQAHLGR